jgi:choline dehydrogenase-like flavoprotein
MAGCDVVAKYNAANVQIMPALDTGKLTLLHDAIVSEITVNSENRVDGVRYLHRHTLREGQVRARVVVVSCGCVQSVALLLMSRSRLYPTGLANSSGNLGKNFIPHIHGNLLGFAKDLIGTKPIDEEGALDHGYIPSYMHSRKRDFAGSFHIQLSFHNRRLVPWAKEFEGFGSNLKRRIKDHYPAFVHLFSLAEMFPNSDSKIDLDPVNKDRYGLPKARTQVRYGENDRQLFAAIRSEVRRIAEASNVEILSDWPEPGRNHALGGCRMGNDSRTSVVNSFCQSHDIPNLFVVDGSVFPSGAEKNPTLTILALAARTADYLVDRFRRLEV